MSEQKQKKVVLILQARMGSVRLPGKSLIDLAGKPLIVRILDRVKQTRLVNDIVLATSTMPENDPLAQLALDEGVAVFRGSEDDLVDRYYQAAREYEADVVLRLPADNVCSEPAEFDRLIAFHLASDFQFSSNICNFMNNGYPDGIGVEAIEFEALETVWKNETRAENREHVALNFYDYIGDKLPEGSTFSVGTIKCPPGYARPDIFLDVNTMEDLESMKLLYRTLLPNHPNFGIAEIVDYFNLQKRKTDNG